MESKDILICLFHFCNKVVNQTLVMWVCLRCSEMFVVIIVSKIEQPFCLKGHMNIG